MPQTLNILADFERVVEALKNPKSHFIDYCVKEFGYCTRCKEVTEFTERRESDIHGTLGWWTICNNCGHGAFSGSRSLGSYTSDHHSYMTRGYITGMPELARQELKQLHSREAQKRFFLELLDREVGNKFKNKIKAEEIYDVFAELRDSLNS